MKSRIIIDAIKEREISTPSLVIIESTLHENLHQLRSISERYGCELLYALKACSLRNALSRIQPHVDGYSVSSLFEAELSTIVDSDGMIHFVGPVIKPDEVVRLSEICDYINFNSLLQWHRIGRQMPGKAQCGLRINPQWSLVKDRRYNPCRENSKLGMPLTQLSSLLRNDLEAVDGITGLHFHNNCDSTDFLQLYDTVNHIETYIPNLLDRIQWMNIGGGYLFDDAVDLQPFSQTLDLLNSKYHVRVFIEPGAAIIRKAGLLIASVLDLFESDGKTIAILDTTVNHMPEVFEYQFEPDVLGHVEDGQHEYILAGCSCLAGDVFGEYAFDEPLMIGSKVIFTDMGAYTMVKAHMFNGINLPSIYTLADSGEMVLEKAFTFQDFTNLQGANEYAHI